MGNLRRGVLDYIWSRSGTNSLKRYFKTMAGKSRRTAVRLINEDSLSFPVLFILSGEIYALDMFRQLNLRNKTALQLCAFKAMPAGQRDAMIASGSGSLRQTLRWMLSTGKNWDGFYQGYDAFDEIMDYVSALLTGTFGDRSALPDIVDLIFRRNRKGLYIHDLVWSFFQTLDANALALVAGRLKSTNLRDVELAGKLLHLNITLPADGRELAALYACYMQWLDENRPYIYLTGEHFQMTGRPNHMDYDREAKYLHKPISPRDQTPSEPLDDNEIVCLLQYRQATEEEREILSEYSHKLWVRDKRQWDDWMQSQVAQQVSAARKDLGLSDDYY